MLIKTEETLGFFIAKITNLYKYNKTSFDIISFEMVRFKQ